MVRFLSHYAKKIDAKGRVSVPAAFRSQIAQAELGELYCFQDLVFPAVSVGGPQLLARFERQMEALDPFSVEANQMSLLIHGGGMFVRLDKEGRLSVTEFILDFTGVTDQVMFVGRGEYFQLWQPQAFRGLQAEARAGRSLRA